MPHKYGWRPDLPDRRDRVYKWFPFARTLPQKVDLRDRCGGVLNQHSLGSCTAQALAQMHLFVQRKEQRSRLFLPSRLFIYFNERFEEDTLQIDAGASIRTGIKTIAKYGVCEENLWGYDITKFRDTPPPACYTQAVRSVALKYHRIDSLPAALDCLASGYPFVFGFSIYESFESADVGKTGIAPMPKDGEAFFGGHAVMAVGYDSTTQHLIVMNSWGPTWGDKGYFYLPFKYVIDRNLSDDYWTISDVA